MSSMADTYKILVAGDEEIGFGMCLRLTDKEVADPRATAREMLSRDWPKDEWTKFFSFSTRGQISTVELDLELHGPWVWELYNVMSPHDYFRRFDGALICGNPKKRESLGEVSSFIEAMTREMDDTIPMAIVLDVSIKPSAREITPFRKLAKRLDVKLETVDTLTGATIEDLFRWIAHEVHLRETG